MKRGLWLAVLVAAGVSAAADPVDLASVLAQVCQGHERVAAPGFNVAVSMRRDGKEVRFKQTCGLADLGTRRYLSSETPFYLASLTKQFTAFAVLLLEKDGKLSLDHPVSRYVPGARWPAAVRIRDLMQHTSGMREHWTMWRLSAFPGDTLDEIARLLAAQQGLDFAPGERFQYTNANYVLLAAVVRKASGKPLPQFLRERVFAPLGMTATAFATEGAFDADVAARGYVPSGEGFAPFAFKASDIVGDGGLWSSVDDLLRWSRELLAPTLGVSAARRKAVRHFADGAFSGYGAGIRRVEHDGHVSWEHGGGFGGASTYLATFPDAGLSIVVLANSGDLDASAIFREVRDAVLRSRPTEPGQQPGVVACTPPAHARWFGLLGDRPVIARARVEDGTLVTTLAGGSEREYRCRADGAWQRVDTPQITARFHEPATLVISMNGDPVASVYPVPGRMPAPETIVGDYRAPDIGSGVWRVRPVGETFQATAPRGESSILVEIAPAVFHAPSLGVLVVFEAAAARLFAPGARDVLLTRTTGARPAG